jgi:hypothetical protein
MIITRAFGPGTGLGLRSDLTPAARAAGVHDTTKGMAMVAGLLALSLLAAGPGGTDGAPQRFKIEVKQTQTIDLSAMNQGTQENGINATGFVTITMSDTAGGKIAHVVLDSMMIEATGGAAGQFPTFLADSARGAIWHLYVVGGKIQGEPKASKESPATALVQQGIGSLFNPVKGAKVGDTWTDTTNVNNSNEQGSTTGTTITIWTVDGLAGGVFTMTAKATGTLSGEQQGGQMLISGTTTSTAKVVSAAGGPAASVGIESTQTMSITVPMADAPIPINGKTTVTVTPLP